MSQTKKQIVENISDILPKDSSTFIREDGTNMRTELLNQQAEKVYDKNTAKALAKVRWHLKHDKEGQISKDAQIQYKKEKEKHTEQAIEQLEAEDPYITPTEAINIGNEVARLHGQPTIDMASNTAKSIMAMSGTTKPEIVRLLTQLNINLNLQLTKTDTANLLACLLTANENQLKALYKNKKVPIAIRTIIKRLLDDEKLGNIETVEKLWDRVFGKAGMMLNLPEQAQTATGIIPNTPVSREAYILIRDTLIQ